MANTQSARRTKARDNFSPAQKQTLARRVNYHCSICDAQTSGPESQSDKAFGIGVAAHIKAAAPGGPRYDASQSQEERRSSLNGIWLCANCSIAIDGDASAYSVDKLIELKARAESRARSRLGKAPTAALSMPSSPAEISRAVEIFCMTEAARKEVLDPRFAVSVFHSNGTTVYELRARQTVATQMVVGAEDRERFIQGLRDLHNYGGTVQFDNIVAKMEGSPLFQSSSEIMQRLELSTGRHQAVLMLKLTSSYAVTTFIEFHGHVSRGAKGMRFNGRALGELVAISLSSDIGVGQSTLKLDFDPNGWKGKPLLKLPHFGRLRELVGAITDEAVATVSVEVEGEEIFAGTGTLPGGPLIQAHDRFLGHIDVLRRLDRFFGLDLVMPLSLEDVFDDGGNLEELLQLLGSDDSEDSEITMTMTANDTIEFAELVEKIQERQPMDLLLKQEIGLYILGRDYGYYIVEFGCTGAIVDVVGPTSLKHGVPVQLSCRPAQGRRWRSRMTGKGPLRNAE